MLSIFSIVWSLLECGWKLICWAGEILWKLATGSLHMGYKFLTAVFDLLMTPFSWGIDKIWDIGVWSSCSLFGIVWWGLVVLLTACGLIAVVALAGNAYRRYKRR